MQWLEITIPTAPGGIEDVATALTAGGFADLVLEDQGELEAFLEQNRACWDYIDEELQAHLQGISCIKLYLEDTDADGFRRLQEVLDTLKRQDADKKLGALTLSAVPLAHTDWEESWKGSYPPQEVGKRLVVLPYWRQEEAFGSRLPVILDPGLTFGTGAHPTTQMVMETMEDLVRPGWDCLDLGSGSGILSITALRLGAKSAVGVDIDPKAEDIARENAAYNGFSAPVFTAYTGNVILDRNLMTRLKQRRYDLVLVNIVADVIIHLAPTLPQLLDGNSTLICSGILDVRLPEVRAALEQAGLAVTQLREKEEWRCICAKRRNI